MPRFDPGVLDGTTVASLRAALEKADFTVGAVGERLGATAHAALLRNDTTPAVRATTGGDSLDTLTRLFALQIPAAAPAADHALPGLLAPLCAAGILAAGGNQVRACVDVRPYADESHDWWVVSDLTPGLDGFASRVAADHVLGVSPAATSLAQLTLREPVATALDLGTGCGLQSLHLAGHADRVVATDVNPRARAMASLTGRLNVVGYEVRAGSLFDPVREETFDLITTNPPFVISPATDEPLVYRDSGLPGDEVVRRIVSGAPAHLRDGGWCQVLANWAHRRGQPWQERLAGWVAGTGCDAWVLQRETADLATYVEMWLADAGLLGTADYVARYDAWLGWLEEQRIEAIGFGWVCLRKAGRDVPVVRIEDWPYEVEQPLAPHVGDWGVRCDLLEGLSDQALLQAHLRCRPDVVQQTIGEPGAADPATVVLRQQSGLRRARRADTVQAALVGACDGELSVGQILTALATLLDEDASDLVVRHLSVVRELVDEGFLDV